MLSPGPAAVARLAFAGWFGLVLGTLFNEFRDSLVMTAVIYGIVLAGFEWLLPTAPERELREEWKGFRGGDRRRIQRAVATGGVAEPGPVRRAAANAAAAVAERGPSGWTLLRLALLPVGVVVGAVAGAPPGWLAAGAVGAAVGLAAEAWARTRGRERARLAVAANGGTPDVTRP
jgi:uncharacterized membrane protein